MIEDLSIYLPDSFVSDQVVEVARRLIERVYGEQVQLLQALAVQRFDWASPFFWIVRFANGNTTPVVMRYDNASNRWHIEPGTSQEWTFEVDTSSSWHIV